MKILNFSKTFKNGVFGDFEILKSSSNKPPLVLVLRKTRGGLLLETGLIAKMKVEIFCGCITRAQGYPRTGRAQ